MLQAGLSLATVKLAAILFRSDRANCVGGTLANAALLSGLKPKYADTTELIRGHFLLCFFWRFAGSHRSCDRAHEESIRCGHAKAAHF